MNVLITGGTGMIGARLMRSLLDDGNKVWILSRRPERMQPPQGSYVLGWDGRSPRGWGERMSEMEAVINLAGATIGAWPWTNARKQLIISSRVEAGRAVAQAIEAARPRPQVLIQSSGIGHYGPCDERRLTEESPAGNDFLAQITRQWEGSSQIVEKLGVRRVVIRSAIVLEKNAGIMPQMSLPSYLFAGGPLGNGRQGVSWIHRADALGAIKFLLTHESAVGPFNLTSPSPVSNADFMRALAGALKRPYWLPVPSFALRLGLGEMSTLLLDGQYALPKRLLELGYNFKYPELDIALAELFA